MGKNVKSIEASSSAVIRDNFSMPSSDYGLIKVMQDRLLKQHATVKNKSEIVRAGLHALSQMTSDDLLAVTESIERLKPGRKPS
jgi:hypothetical protein